MPTAVERLLESFLKLTGIRDQGALNEASLKIDDAFLKLSNANEDSFLKIEGSAFIKFDFEKIGDSFIKLGDDFHKISVAGEVIDQTVLKLTGGPTVNSVDSGPGLQTDFVTLDHKLNTTSTDLKILGTDFLKLDTAPNLDVFQQKADVVVGDFIKLGTDMAADRVAFLKLSADFLKLSQGGDRPSPLDLAYKELGGELQAVGDTFGLLATDFVKVGDAIAHGTGGGAGRPGDLNAAAGGGGAGDQIGAALTLLYQHFHALDLKLDALGDGSVRLIHDLLPAVDQGASQLFADGSHQGNGHG
jgi:hypothetical protein